MTAPAVQYEGVRLQACDKASGGEGAEEEEEEEGLQERSPDTARQRRAPHRHQGVRPGVSVQGA